jgi:hypothetical protein
MRMFEPNDVRTGLVGPQGDRDSEPKGMDRRPASREQATIGMSSSQPVMLVPWRSES